MSFIISSKIQDALNKQLPIVALESTIITHGMPYPQNYETALIVENFVRLNGAIPATIAILDGNIRVGLDNITIKKLAKIGLNCKKISRRDITNIMAFKNNGGTTVAATAWIANKVGISVFVTGGIGGVHRGVENTMDISSDINELGRTRICVVSAGVKSILDISKTLEYLETQGVNVVTFRNNEFPAFFTRESGIKTPLRLDSPNDIARCIVIAKRLSLNSGMVCAVPVPSHQAGKMKNIESATKLAIKETKDKLIKGRDITPYLLLRINELTKGKSLKANISLIKNNVKIGSKISVEVSKLEKIKKNDVKRRIAIVGGCSVDRLGRPEKDLSVIMKTSTPGRWLQNFGGVGSNIAKVLGRLGHKPIFISVVGNDFFGLAALQNLKKNDIDTSGISVLPDLLTSQYSAIHDSNGDLKIAIADFSIIEQGLQDFLKTTNFPIYGVSTMLIIDGNLEINVIQYLVNHARQTNTKIWYEPISVIKAVNILSSSKRLDGITFISPNLDELNVICKAAGGSICETKETRCRFLLSIGCKIVCLTLGTGGVLLVDSHSTTFINAKTMINNKNANGAGDNFVGGSVSGWLDGLDFKSCILRGILTASLSIKYEETVSSCLNPSFS